jgi:3-dehydroquinate synthase class II
MAKKVFIVWRQTRSCEINGIIGVCTDREEADRLLETYINGTDIILSKKDISDLKKYNTTRNSELVENYAIEEFALNKIDEGVTPFAY